MSLKKKLDSDEIDLVDLFLTLWNYKWNIILFIAIPVILMFLFVISQPKKEISYNATTEVKPISTFDEFEYESYNSYLKNSNNNILYSFNPFKENLDKLSKQSLIFKDIDLYNNVDNSSFKRIDKTFLLSLFFDKLSESLIFEQAIKKFKLIKKEDYQSNEDFENAIMKLSSLITLKSKFDENNNLSNFNIEFSTKNKEVWEKILMYVEEIANKEIQKYLNETFNKLILNQKRLIDYKIEDLEILISNSKKENNKLYIASLNALKNDIIENKNIVRLQTEFQSTPIVRSTKFYAAKIMVKSTSFKNSNVKKYKLLPMLILSGLFGAILGIFYSLIVNSMKKRT